MNAPLRCPKSALVIRSPESAGQLTVTNGASARGLFARIQRASTFLPVPLSPRKQEDGVRRRRPRGGLQEPKKRRTARLEERRLAALVELFLEFGEATPEPLRLDHAMRGQDGSDRA